MTFFEVNKTIKLMIALFHTKRYFYSIAKKISFKFIVHSFSSIKQ
jgi:hypothetical protein